MSLQEVADLIALKRTLRGCLASLTIGLNTALAALPVFFISLLKLLIPIRTWRIGCSHQLNRIAEFWINCNDIWLPKPAKIEWKNFEPATLSEKKTYLITSNHQTWADIFLVQHLLNQRTPQIKFFLKQELIWIPIIGLCWWALDFPFMKRYSKSYLKKHPNKKGKDQETTRKACEKFRTIPVAIYNFMEGTRFTEEKKKRQKSPFKHLLKPKAGGTGLVLSALSEQVDSLIDITIYYQDKAPGFWDLLCGDNGHVRLYIEKRDIPPAFIDRDYAEDGKFRAELLQWLNEVWAEKDQLLKTLQPDNDKKEKAERE